MVQNTTELTPSLLYFATIPMATSKRLSDGCVRRLVLQALSRDDISDAQVLVQNMVDMHEKAFALSEAVKTSQIKAVSAFIEAGSDPFLKHQGRTALVTAIMNDDVECLKALLSKYLPLSKYLQSLNDDRKLLCRVKRGINEVLFESASICAIESVEFLLSVGADCNTYYYHDDEFLSWCTPLIAACYCPISPVCRGVSTQNATATILKLIEHGADLNKTNHLGDTALHWACGAALLEVVGILLRNGADINHQNKMGKTSLMNLAEMYKEKKSEDCLSVAKILIQHGADLTQIDLDGWTALHYAVESKSTRLVHLLLEGGADPNQHVGSYSIATRRCISILSLAVLHDSLDIIRLLLRWNACPNSDRDFPPFNFACEWQNTDIAKLLFEAGLNNSAIIRGIDANLVPKEVDQSFWIELRKIATTPPPLKLLSRTVIRKTLGRSLWTANKQNLPIPGALIAYIKLET